MKTHCLWLLLIMALIINNTARAQNVKTVSIQLAHEDKKVDSLIDRFMRDGRSVGYYYEFDCFRAGNGYNFSVNAFKWKDSTVNWNLAILKEKNIRYFLRNGSYVFAFGEDPFDLFKETNNSKSFKFLFKRPASNTDLSWESPVVSGLFKYDNGKFEDALIPVR